MAKFNLTFIVLLLAMKLYAPSIGAYNCKDTGFKRWESLLWAIGSVESQHNNNAYNPKSGALGKYQMKKIYVDEVNRILKKKVYTYKDRKNPKKAAVMFNIYQGHHNKKHNIKRAIRLHRGLNSPKYERAVLKEMRKAGK